MMPAQTEVQIERHRERNRAWKRANKDKVAASARRRYHANKEKSLAGTMAWKARRPNYHRDWYLQQEYGMSFADKVAMMASQNYKCAICKCTFTGDTDRNAHIDHCHGTHQVRAILCNTCNSLLGMAKDSTDTLIAAAAYLGLHGKR